MSFHYFLTSYVMNISELFPEIPEDIKEVDLNQEARVYLQELWIISPEWIWREQNPLIHPIACEKFLRWVHKKHQTKFSYGGYWEDRSTLWHNTYLDTLWAYHHLGVDFNVPAGTHLISPVSWKVVISDHDSDHPTAPQMHGWWNRLIVDPLQGDYLIILAHLSENTRRRVGSIIEKWEILWTIGTETENGGWFEHFHIQAISRTKFDEILALWKLPELHGYAKTMDEATMSMYPNPMKLI